MLTTSSGLLYTLKYVARHLKTTELATYSVSPDCPVSTAYPVVLPEHPVSRICPTQRSTRPIPSDVHWMGCELRKWSPLSTALAYTLSDQHNAAF